ncbi:MAG: hypothetical protein OSA47_09075, partial [Novosphingopyxis baekryungensis]|nr:hypothetical protein [Novosphingopyxis baekryungensis]
IGVAIRIGIIIITIARRPSEIVIIGPPLAQLSIVTGNFLRLAGWQTAIILLGQAGGTAGYQAIVVIALGAIAQTTVLTEAEQTPVGGSVPRRKAPCRVYHVNAVAVPIALDTVTIAVALHNLSGIIDIATNISSCAVDLPLDLLCVLLGGFLNGFVFAFFVAALAAVARGKVDFAYGCIAAGIAFPVAIALTVPVAILGGSRGHRQHGERSGYQHDLTHHASPC